MAKTPSPEQIQAARQQLDKHLRPVARQFFILGLILGVLAGGVLGYLIGQRGADRYTFPRQGC